MRAGPARVARSPLIAFLPVLFVPALLLAFPHTVWPAVVGYHVFCAVLPTVAGQDLRDSRLRSWPSRWWMIATVLISLLLVAIGGLAAGVVENARDLLPAGWEVPARLLHLFWLFAVYSIVVNAFLEEYFWRGFVSRKTGLQGSVLFWAMHAAAASVYFDVGIALLLTAPSLAAALAWAWMTRSSGSLWPAIVTHVAADAAILIAAHRPVTRL
jgi:membrane protease YdiL (CAAX protease family)